MDKRVDPGMREAVSRAEAASDAACVARVLAGDPDAFRHLFERYRQRAFVLAFGVVGSEDDARDVVQDAFVRAYKSLPSFAGTSSFYTWFYRIVLNLSIDHKRKMRRVKLDDFAEHGTSEGAIALETLAFSNQPLGFDPRKALLDGELSRRIREALSELSEAHRTVLVLREIDGLSYEEIASVMECSKGTVMSRLFHARRNMQSKLLDLKDISGVSASEEYIDASHRPTEEP